ncbi:MAG: TrkH family potassium uptake protein [Lachnospiraceae bacterium]|nr:TrkH family potassium uptake protein [Lachnospiraceae bacterium]
MNSSVVRYTLGQVLKIEAVLLLLPCIVALIYKEDQGIYYVLVATMCAFLGMGMTLRKPGSNIFYLKEGCIITALSWIFLSFFGALPFYLSGEIPSLTNALFETISGFTTTGASILSEVESLSRCSTFWRCFTHWIGGMGVLVFLLAIIPIGGGSQINIMKAESPGPSVGKLVPKVRSTARILYIIYFALTIIEIIFLVSGGMPAFEAVNTAIATAGTGGFGIKNDSIAGYSAYLQWVVTIFMILFGVNFNAYYLLIFRQFRKAFTMEEVIHYFAIIFIAIAIIFTRIFRTYDHALDALRDTAFQVASIITTTGFSTVDFDKWPAVCQTVLVFLMFIGACAGSTGGGIKVSRLIILRKTIIKEMISYVHPKSIKKIKMDDKPVEHEVVRATNVFFITFVIIFSLSVLLVSIDGNDLVTNFTAVAATINNIGPGLSMVGPTQNFSHFSGFSKYILMFDMIAGRLELFPLLMLFHPELWKEMFAHYIRKFSNSN